MTKLDDYPDMVIGCIGGGRSFGGVAFPFIKDKINGKDLRLIAVELEACPTLTRGLYAYDFGDTAELTPLVRMFTLGHTFVPPRIHAGGLRYHGTAPLISQLHHDGIIEAQTIHQHAVFAPAVQFAQLEAIIPAPEPSHPIHVAIQEALKCKESGGRQKTSCSCCVAMVTSIWALTTSTSQATSWTNRSRERISTRRWPQSRLLRTPGRIQ
jgi:tryptophan synthase beta chain